MSKRQRKRKEYQRFVRQLYHACIKRIFEPLRQGMTTPEVVRCPDGHFRRAVYAIGPVIADYPEQVWLSGIVQNWCPKYVISQISGGPSTLFLTLQKLTRIIFRCHANPRNLDNPSATRRTHEKADVLIQYWDTGTLWNTYGIRDDVVVSEPNLGSGQYSYSQYLAIYTFVSSR